MPYRYLPSTGGGQSQNALFQQEFAIISFCSWEATDERCTNHGNLHVRGYKEEGTTSTPFDMVVMNNLDRFHLCEDVVDRLPQLGARAAYFKQAIHDRLIEHKEYIEKHGDDLPAVSGWKWGSKASTKSRGTSTEGDNV